jgi:NAD(P)-dependent dehydrogenase (short-subunit alcohol dehydrogenase family)
MSAVFNGQTVIVSGGTGALGKVVTTQFLEKGARVVVPYISEQELQDFITAHPTSAKSIHFFHADLREEPKVREFVDQAISAHGPPWALANLVGGYEYGAVLDAGLADIQHMMQVNFAPTYLLCKAVLPHMLRAGRGKIVNVGARTGIEGTAFHAAYAVSKSAVIRLTEVLSAEVKRQGVNVNCVLPSVIDTPANRQAVPDAEFTQWVAPADLAEVITFLCSEASRAVHGAAIPVYGLA